MVQGATAITYPERAAVCSVVERDSSSSSTIEDQRGSKTLFAIAFPRQVLNIAIYPEIRWLIHSIDRYD